MTFRPLLAATLDDVANLRFPVLVSPKLDGVRCLVRGGEAVTRNLKPVPNAHVRRLLSHVDNLDGELVVGEPFAAGVFNRTVSAVMRRDGEPEFKFFAFDRPDDPRPFALRQLLSGEEVLRSSGAVRPVVHTWIEDEAALLEYESRALARGYEGVMIRDPNGPYKHGRSTLKEGALLKLKRFEDAEAVVIGFEELQHNGNAATTDALGHTERSTHKAGLTAGGTLGALVVQADGWPEPFRIGTGFDAAARLDIWTRREALLGQRLKFKHQAIGAKDAPRFPVFLGGRPEGA